MFDPMIYSQELLPKEQQMALTKEYLIQQQQQLPVQKNEESTESSDGNKESPSMPDGVLSAATMFKREETDTASRKTSTASDYTFSSSEYTPENTIVDGMEDQQTQPQSETVVQQQNVVEAPSVQGANPPVPPTGQNSLPESPQKEPKTTPQRKISRFYVSPVNLNPPQQDIITQDTDKIIQPNEVVTTAAPATEPVVPEHIPPPDVGGIQPVDENANQNAGDQQSQQQPNKQQASAQQVVGPEQINTLEQLKIGLENITHAHVGQQPQTHCVATSNQATTVVVPTSVNPAQAAPVTQKSQQNQMNMQPGFTQTNATFGTVQEGMMMQQQQPIQQTMQMPQGFVLAQHQQPVAMQQLPNIGTNFQVHHQMPNQMTTTIPQMAPVQQMPVIHQNPSMPQMVPVQQMSQQMLPTNQQQQLAAVQQMAVQQIQQQQQAAQGGGSVGMVVPGNLVLNPNAGGVAPLEHGNVGGSFILTNSSSNAAVIGQLNQVGPSSFTNNPPSVVFVDGGVVHQQHMPPQQQQHIIVMPQQIQQQQQPVYVVPPHQTHTNAQNNTIVNPNQFQMQSAIPQQQYQQQPQQPAQQQQQMQQVQNFQANLGQQMGQIGGHQQTQQPQQVGQQTVTTGDQHSSNSNSQTSSVMHSRRTSTDVLSSSTILEYHQQEVVEQMRKVSKPGSEERPVIR